MKISRRFWFFIILSIDFTYGYLSAVDVFIVPSESMAVVEVEHDEGWDSPCRTPDNCKRLNQLVYSPRVLSIFVYQMNRFSDYLLISL